MKALMYVAPERVELQDVPNPSLLPGQVVLRIAATGICGAATFTVSSNGILIGGAPSGVTMAMFGFNGVSTAYSNYQSTILNAAVQTQTQSP